jgi:leucyl/phenylalanyl-tRNA--protein transferase
MAYFFAHQNEYAFPHPSQADSHGVLAIGGDLHPERLLLAYHFGIFPWYNEGEPILWWCPDPRFVIKPAEVYIAKSMRKYFNQDLFHITYDTRFQQVIRFCKEVKRENQLGTWITDEMELAYIKLHELGFAHSVEVWENGDLVGGLYGIALGKCFFGESMFSKVSNASKFGFIQLCLDLDKRGYSLIDCQQPNPHLESLGGKFMDRDIFLAYLKENRKLETEKGNWSVLFSG